jgi:hypothetical protein
MTIKDLAKAIRSMPTAAGYLPMQEETNTIIILTPEQKYKQRKQAWYFHPSSWYMRTNQDDGQGCSQHRGCIPECPYYADEGRIEDSDG